MEEKLLLNQKSKLNLREKIKKKLCSKILKISDFIFNKCIDKETTQENIQILKKLSSQSKKYENIMQNKDALYDALIRVEKENQDAKELHILVSNQLNDINALIHNNQHMLAHQKLKELLQHYYFQTEGDNHVK